MEDVNLLDYTDPDYLSQLDKCDKYACNSGYTVSFLSRIHPSRIDVVFDCAGQNNPDAIRTRSTKDATYVTLSSPLLKSTDSGGLLLGAVKSISDLLNQNLRPKEPLSARYRWGYFMPIPGALEKMTALADHGKVCSFVMTGIVLKYKDVYCCSFGH